jgi:hypothetical protein
MKFAYLGAAAVAAIAMSVAAPASAEVYAGVHAGGLTLNFDSLPVDDGNLATIGGRLGWKANKWVGIEGDLFFGAKDDRINDAPPIDVKIDSAAFIYAVGFLPVSEQFDVIGRVGYGHVAAKVESPFGSSDTNDGAASYGVGAQFKWDQKNAVRFDYTYYDLDDVSTNGYTVAYVRTF